MNVISASKVHHSSFRNNSIRVGFERFTGKMSDLHLNSTKRLVEVTRLQ